MAKYRILGQVHTNHIMMVNMPRDMWVDVFSGIPWQQSSALRIWRHSYIRLPKLIFSHLHHSDIIDFSITSIMDFKALNLFLFLTSTNFHGGGGGGNVLTDLSVVLYTTICWIMQKMCVHKQHVLLVFLHE